MIPTVAKNELFTFIDSPQPAESTLETFQYLSMLERIFDSFVREFNDNILNASSVYSTIQYLDLIRETAYAPFGNENPLEKTKAFNNCATTKKHRKKYEKKEVNDDTKLVLKFFKEVGNPMNVASLKNEIEFYETQDLKFSKVSLPYLKNSKDELVELLEQSKERGLNSKILQVIASESLLHNVSEFEVRKYCRLIFRYVLNIRKSEILHDIIGFVTIRIKQLSKNNGVEKYFIKQSDIPKLKEILIQNAIIDSEDNWKGVVYKGKIHDSKNIIYALIESLYTSSLTNQKDNVNIRRCFFQLFNLKIGSGITRLQEKNKYHDHYVKHFNKLLTQLNFKGSEVSEVK